VGNETCSSTGTKAYLIKDREDLREAASISEEEIRPRRRRKLCEITKPPSFGTGC
jgi:hypothetical protein